MNSLKRIWDDMRMKNKIPLPVKASGVFLVCFFLQKSISAITTPIFTRLFSTSEYGQFNVFNSWMSIISIFVTLNLSSGVYVQALVKFEDERNTVVSSSQGLNFILFIGSLCVYFAFSSFWNQLFGLSYIQMTAMLLLIWTSSVFNFWAAEQRVTYQYRKLLILTLLVSFLKPVLGILLVYFAEDKVTARIFGWVLVEVVCYIYPFFSQIKKGPAFSAKFWKYMLSFAVPLIPHYLSQVILNNSDRIMISVIVNDSAAGIYSLAYSIAQITMVLNTALLQTIAPWMYRKIKKRDFKNFTKFSYLTICVVSVINLLLIALAPELVTFFAPAAYHEAMWIIPPISMSVVYIYGYDLFSKFEYYYEKKGFIVSASIGGAVLNIVLNAVFIPIYGYMAAAYTTLVCYILYMFGHYFFMNRICKKQLQGKRIYSIKAILGIYSVFMILGFSFQLLYKFTFVRYGLLVFLIIVLIKRRRKIALSIEALI